MDIYAPLAAAGPWACSGCARNWKTFPSSVLNPGWTRLDHAPRFITLQKETGATSSRASPTTSRRNSRRPAIRADVMGRAKKPFSIWRKMEEKEQGLLAAVGHLWLPHHRRLGSGLLCTALGAIHRRWRSVPGPVQGLHQGGQPKSERATVRIHTPISRGSATPGPSASMVQIRDPCQMHEGRRGRRLPPTLVLPRWGCARETPITAVDPAAPWIADASTERFDNEDDHDEFLEQRQARDVPGPGVLLHAEGRGGGNCRAAPTPPISPTRSTPGSGTAASAPRSTTSACRSGPGCKNGQSVEILTAEGQRPQATWIDIVATGRAKAAIRRSLREEDKERFMKLWSRACPRRLRQDRQEGHRQGAHDGRKADGSRRPQGPARPDRRPPRSPRATSSARLYPEIEARSGDEDRTRPAPSWASKPSQTFSPRALLPAGAPASASSASLTPGARRVNDPRHPTAPRS